MPLHCAQAGSHAPEVYAMRDRRVHVVIDIEGYIYSYVQMSQACVSHMNVCFVFAHITRAVPI